MNKKNVDRIVKHIDKMIPLNSRVTSLEDDIKSIFDIIKGMWSGNIVKWIFTLMIKTLGNLTETCPFQFEL